MENKNIFTYFHDLDAATGGLKRGDLILLASRPSQGKTALALDIAHDVAVMKGLGVALFSLETGGKVIYERMACAHTPIESFRVREDMLTKEQWKALTLKMGELIKAPLFICDKPDLEVKDIKNNIEKLIEQGHKPELVVIDYLELIKQENKQDIVANMYALKELAVKFNVSVLVCSQIRRKKEGAPNRPEIYDLQYPEIAEIADLVLLLHRENYYNQDYKYKYLAEILIKKPFLKDIEISWFSKNCHFCDKIDIKKIKETLDKYHGRGKYERQKYNLEILEQLKQFVQENPTQRFIQALWNLAIVDREDRYNEEPKVTLEKVKSALEKIQKGE